MKSTSTPLTHKPMLHAALLSKWSKKFKAIMANNNKVTNVSSPAAMSHDYYLALIYTVDKKIAIEIKTKCEEEQSVISNVCIEVSREKLVTIKCNIKNHNRKTIKTYTNVRM